MCVASAPTCVLAAPLSLRAQVSEGDQQGNYVALLGNILFPLIAFGGLFFLFRRAQGGQGGCVWG